MSHPYVLLEVSGIGRVELHPGDLIGRLSKMELFINDPYISEAHALITLREGHLSLLPLRGTVKVNGQSSKNAVALHTGLQIQLAPKVTLSVIAVNLPALPPQIQIGDAPPQLLTSSRPWIEGNPPKLNFSDQAPDGAQAPLQFWSTGEQWHSRFHGKIEECVDGSQWEVEGVLIQFIQMDASGQVTQTDDNARVFVDRESAGIFEIIRENRASVVFMKKQATVLSLLANANGSVHWLHIAKKVWPATGERFERIEAEWEAAKAPQTRALLALKKKDIEKNLRNSYDRLLYEIRKRLGFAGIDGHALIYSYGNETLLLHLKPEDRLEHVKLEDSMEAE